MRDVGDVVLLAVNFFGQLGKELRRREADDEASIEALRSPNGRKCRGLEMRLSAPATRGRIEAAAGDRVWCQKRRRAPVSMT